MKMRIPYLFLILLLVAGCSTGAGETNDTYVDNPEDSAEELEVVFLEASWGRIYNTFDELLEDAELIVVGYIGEMIGVKDDLPTVEYLTDPVTFWELHVEMVLTPGAKVPDEPLTLRQYGGILDGVDYRYRDIPPYQSGDRVLLFLVRCTDDSYIAPNHSAAFLIEDDIVYTFTRRCSNSLALRNFQPMELSQLIERHISGD